MNRRVLTKVLIVAAIVAVVLLVRHLNLGQANLDQFRIYMDSNMGPMVGAFMGIYILSTALSLPPGGATALTLLAGAIFGLLWGTIIVSFASTIGATLAFLLSRFFLPRPCN